jgi:hypothetical protein
MDARLHQASDVDLLLFTDNNDWYRHRWKWLTEIDFERAGYSLHSSRNAAYGVVWSRHIHLLPSSEVELEDAFQIIFDKDGMSARLVEVVTAGRG